MRFLVKIIEKILYKKTSNSWKGPNLEDWVVSEDDPGTPLADDEFWYFEVQTDRETGKAIKTRTRKKVQFQK